MSVAHNQTVSVTPSYTFEDKDILTIFKRVYLVHSSRELSDFKITHSFCLPIIESQKYQMKREILVRVFLKC